MLPQRFRKRKKYNKIYVSLPLTSLFQIKPFIQFSVFKAATSVLYCKLLLTLRLGLMLSSNRNVFKTLQLKKNIWKIHHCKPVAVMWFHLYPPKYVSSFGIKWESYRFWSPWIHHGYPQTITGIDLHSLPTYIKHLSSHFDYTKVKKCALNKKRDWTFWLKKIKAYKYRMCPF